MRVLTYPGGKGVSEPRIRTSSWARSTRRWLARLAWSASSEMTEWGDRCVCCVRVVVGFIWGTTERKRKDPTGAHLQREHAAHRRVLQQRGELAQGGPPLLEAEGRLVDGLARAGRQLHGAADEVGGGLRMDYCIETVD